jgi:hypothetical protein
VPNATLASDSLIAKSADRNGRLPAFPAATPEGAAFWQGYALAPAAPSGVAPVPSRLFPANLIRAGLVGTPYFLPGASVVALLAFGLGFLVLAPALHGATRAALRRCPCAAAS